MKRKIVLTPRCGAATCSTMERDKPKGPKDAREARLAQALRANLRRRKGVEPKPAPKDGESGPPD